MICVDVLVWAGVFVCAGVLISSAVLFSAATLFCCGEEPREIRFSSAVNQQDLDGGLLTISTLPTA
jgi:hypothetical protein